MASAMIGIAIRPDSIQLCRVCQGAVTDPVSIPLPRGLVEQGRVTDPGALASLIRKALAAGGIRGRRCALVLPASLSLARSLTLPTMTDAQRKLNLPGKFRNLVDRPLSDYNWDCIPLSEGPQTQEVYAAGVLRTPAEEYRRTLKQAGLTLMTLLPPEMAWRNQLLARPDLPDPLCILEREEGILRLYHFSGGRFITLRELPHAGSEPGAAAEAIRRAVNLYNFSLSPGHAPLAHLLTADDWSPEDAALLGRITGLTILPASRIPGGSAAGAALQPNDPTQAMNLITPQKDFDARKMVPLAAILALGLLAFAKFGILDPLEEKAAAYNALSARQEQLAQANARLENYDSILEEYLRYCRDGMTPAEIAQVNREEILELVESIVAPAAGISDLTINQNVLTLSLSGITLEEAGALVSRLEAQSTVAHAGILSATAADGGAAKVLLSITVHIPEEEVGNG